MKKLALSRSKVLTFYQFCDTLKVDIILAHKPRTTYHDHKGGATQTMGRLGKPESGKANPKLCPICNHPNRAEIEQAIFSISPNSPNLTLDMIANAYDLSTNDLRVHALMHSPFLS